MGRRKKKGHHAKGARKWGIAVFVLAFSGLLGIGSLLFIKDSRSFDTFRKGAEQARSLLSTRLKDSLLIPSPTPLNEAEKGFIWAKEFDLAVRETLPKMGLDSANLGGSGSGGVQTAAVAGAERNLHSPTPRGSSVWLNSRKISPG